MCGTARGVYAATAESHAGVACGRGLNRVPIEVGGFPPLRPKKGARTGHGVLDLHSASLIAVGWVSGALALVLAAALTEGLPMGLRCSGLLGLPEKLVRFLG